MGIEAYTTRKYLYALDIKYIWPCIHSWQWTNCKRSSKVQITQIYNDSEVVNLSGRCDVPNYIYTILEETVMPSLWEWLRGFQICDHSKVIVLILSVKCDDLDAFHRLHWRLSCFSGTNYMSLWPTVFSGNWPVFNWMQHCCQTTVTVTTEASKAMSQHSIFNKMSKLDHSKNFSNETIHILNTLPKPKWLYQYDTWSLTKNCTWSPAPVSSWRTLDSPVGSTPM